MATGIAHRTVRRGAVRAILSKLCSLVVLTVLLRGLWGSSNDRYWCSVAVAGLS